VSFLTLVVGSLIKKIQIQERELAEMYAEVMVVRNVLSTSAPLTKRIMEKTGIFRAFSSEGTPLNEMPP
jgi:hypothetical protein